MDDDFPAVCEGMALNDTCEQGPDGTWTVFPGGDSLDGAQGPGIPGGFIALVILILLVGVAITVYKVSMARNMARRSGMSTSEATVMTLIDDDGLSATYLASNLRERPGGDQSQAGTPARGDTADRLRELAGLLDQGLITPSEHDERRQAILDQL